MAIVLDVSATVAWCFKDEATPASAALAESVAAEGADVPGIWPLEVMNTLLMGVRRGRIGAPQVAAFVATLRSMNIRVDAETNARAWTDTAAIASEHALTAYDAAYIELARRTGAVLATKDNAMRRVAASLGLPTIAL